MSITATSFMVLLVVVTVAMLVATVVVGRRHHLVGWSGAVVTLMCVVVTVAAGVNSYYAYLPNVASLFGWRAADQSSWVAARRTVVRVVPGALTEPPAHGAVVRVAIPGVRSGFHARPAEVYLPPAWFLSPKPRLPVIEMLHGTPGTPEDWTRSSGADRISDRWAAAHHGLAPILVMPDINGSFAGDSECTDGTAGAVETYLSIDVPNWVLNHLSAADARDHWAIGGLSEGGTCAIDLALRHPDRWATFLDFGGDDHISRSGGVQSLFRGPIWHRRGLVASYDPVRLVQGVREPSAVQGWFEAGASDGETTRATKRLAAMARLRGMDVHLALRGGGGHDWRVWRNCFRDALPWVSLRLGAGSGLMPGPPDPHALLVDLSHPATLLGNARATVTSRTAIPGWSWRQGHRARPTVAGTAGHGDRDGRSTTRRRLAYRGRRRGR